MTAHSLRTLAVALLLAACGPALASTDGADDTVPEILQTQHALRTKLDQPGGDASRYSSEDLSRMRRAQDKVFRMLDGVASLDELNAAQRTDLSNALDEIKATLAHASDERLVCHRERRTGTNLVEKRCETVAQREARTRETQEQLREFAPTVSEHSGH